ncbi:MAG: PQQ-binding-like beta-propeller repeat protein [Alphaproteobacteria bacterium]|nr:PQQ-binding-like beta-propeller repeat protein [Alphaproteobacteria bacterium]
MTCRGSRRHSRVAAAIKCAPFLGLIWLLSTSAGLAQAPGSEQPNDWPQYHRTSNAWRYSPLTQINKANVKKLKVAWIAQGGDITSGIQETPIVIDGIVYSITAGDRVAALDGKTGTTLWRYQPKLDPLTSKIIAAPYSRGVAVGRGKVFIGTIDGRGIALDQKTGKELWSVQLTDFKECDGCNFTSPPVVAGDVLTFGSTGGEMATSGKIYGVEADTGKKLWEFETIKRDPESWPGESWRFGGGGAWLPGSYDSETDTVFYGTSNPGADFYGVDRNGDNLYTDSVLALDPKTGKLKWYRQEIEHDVWDYDGAYEALLFRRDGKDLLVHLSKSGFVFVMDKKNGKLENVWPLFEGYTFAKSIDPKTGKLAGRLEPKPGQDALICPSAFGGRSWNPGAYNPNTGLWYTTVLEICNTGSPVVQPADPHAYSVLRLGVKNLVFKKIAGESPGRLDARDPITGKRKWTYETALPSFGSVLTTGGGLVFNGDPLGIIRAFDADTGKVLWSFNTGSGLRSGIVSYAAGGKQYILVPSGWGSYVAVFLPALFPEFAGVPGASTLIAFTLE